MIGQTISHYRIVEKLGSGGMGVVYKAQDTNLDRTVALKFLAIHLLESEEHKQRFLREAKAAASLDHPNICMVYEVGEADGHAFLAMGYVDGPEVRAKIRERPLKLEEALDIAIQAAEGLRAAHQKGIVHRDIKSSNLMLTSGDQVKIMDFGLAQLTGGTRLTKADTIVGTPAYMSPEQAQRLGTDRRTDIWSLGVVLYEMVTGRLPFEGEREAVVVHSILHDTHEPITALRVGVPTELDRIVGKALAKKPEERYQHVDDMLVDLRALRNNPGAARIPAVGTHSKARWLWAGLAIVVLGAAYLMRRDRQAAQDAEPPRAVALTTFAGAELYPSFSPDGSHVAFSWTGPRHQNPDLYVIEIGGAGSPRQLTTDPLSDYSPVWSPDGRWIAFLRGDSTVRGAGSLRAGPSLKDGRSELRLVPDLGGPERVLAQIQLREFVIAPYVAWCPDSQCLIVSDSPGADQPVALFVVSLQTGEKKQLTHPPISTLGDTSPALSADSRWLVFRRNLSFGSGRLHWLALQENMSPEGEPRSLTEIALDAVSPAWMPDGREIIFSAQNNLWRQRVAGKAPPARIPFVGEGAVFPAISSAEPGSPARLVYTRTFADLNLWRVDTSGPGTPALAPPSVAVSSTQLDFSPHLSPDGTRVAFSSTRSGNAEIWVSDLDGTHAVQLTSLSAFSAIPRWSPDGGRIVFHSNPDGQYEIYVVAATGGKPRQVTSDPANDLAPGFSRDGASVYFYSNRTGDNQIWKAPATGGNAVQMTENGGYGAFESLDSQFLYYTQSTISPTAIWRLPVAGGSPVKVLDGVSPRDFVVLEKGIYYVDSQSNESRLRFLDFSSGRSTMVAPSLGNYRGSVTGSADGRTILYTRQEPASDDLMLVENFR